MSETIRVKRTKVGNIMLIEKNTPWCIDFPEDEIVSLLCELPYKRFAQQIVEIDDVIVDLKDIKDDG